MFWRVLKQMLRASRGRLAVALIAVTSGAAVVSALVNLQLDVRRKMTAEFRSFGANVIIEPPNAAGAGTAMTLMSESSFAPALTGRSANVLAAAPFLYLVARAEGPEGAQPVVVAGTWLDQVPKLAPGWKMTGKGIDSRDDASQCIVGVLVARELGLAPGSELALREADRTLKLSVAGVAESGGAADTQVLVNLGAAQRLGALEGQAALAEMSVQGSPQQILEFTRGLHDLLPGLAVRPVPQLAAAEGRLLDRIRSLILATVALILVLTGLCVLATMAALAVERRQDVGLMKAIGGSIERVLRMFLTEMGLLGAAGGLIGYALGVLLSEWMGRRVFGTGIAPHWEVLPLTVAVMIGVAIAGAFPLRLLGRIPPAVILRGE